MLKKAQTNLNLSKVAHRFNSVYKGKPQAVLDSIGDFNLLTATLYELGLSYKSKIDRSKKHSTKYRVILLENYESI